MFVLRFESFPRGRVWVVIVYLAPFRFCFWPSRTSRSLRVCQQGRDVVVFCDCIGGPEKKKCRARSRGNAARAGSFAVTRRSAAAPLHCPELIPRVTYSFSSAGEWIPGEDRRSAGVLYKVSSPSPVDRSEAISILFCTIRASPEFFPGSQRQGAGP